ncbi:S16 family peptidase [Cordyceps militaris CM01]|uniref:S16 family peptidase n=1 Tax=Cordyceps militaris (strain CM01) TaxID=983644 RepID=G3JQS7_CORMM|nr:S16 family peptidase [Cordyceps militaris CM01]EGX89103.1 S16 family peptidase [Cordyceps militaris CM01]
MSSDASRHVATPRLDPPLRNETSSPSVADLTPASADMARKLDEYPFPSHPQQPAQASAAGDVPETQQQQPSPGLRLQDVIHLFHCRLCDKLFKEPVTLPCGRSICRLCIPEPHLRSRISYPAVDDRLEGFRCPFASCDKEHTLGDCGVDVTLSKLAEHIRDECAQRHQDAANQSPSTAPPLQQHSLASAPPSESQDSDPLRDTEAPYHHEPQEQTAVGNEPAVDQDESPQPEPPSFARTQQLARSELDCQVCYALYHDPLTTGCGHTFCRSCLHRILDHSRYCPMCRRRLSISPLLNRASCPSNAALARIIAALWPAERAARSIAVRADETARERDLETPLFVCTLAFPQMPTFLHVFEPRYRLLVRRALQGDKTFGMVLPRPPRHADAAAFYELGTLLRIEHAQFYADGRCLIETVGLSRFRVLRHAARDGYAVSAVERVDDISLEEEETTEAAEMAAAAAAPPPPSPSSDAGSEHTAVITVPTLETMATRDLMRLATDFVQRMRDKSVPWMTDSMLAIYGECPVQDPAVFPWWLGSVLPVRDAEKYRLLGSASVRERLKICCRWIIEWETKTWYAQTSWRF